MSGHGFFVLGATHHRAPLDVREKLALDAAGAAALQAELATLAGLRELTVLNTCNRIEFYGVADSPETIARVEAAFCARQRFALHEFGAFRLSLVGRAALQHLFEVAAGLDSQMLGETEIFGQVKAAYATAQARQSTGPVLNRVFQKTFQAAKHVRTHTAITTGQVSIANVAVDLAQNIFGDLTATRILLLGAGDIGEKTAKAFQSRGAASLTVASRRLERAMELATEFGASAPALRSTRNALGRVRRSRRLHRRAQTAISSAAVAAALRKRPARAALPHRSGPAPRHRGQRCAAHRDTPSSTTSTTSPRSPIPTAPPATPRSTVPAHSSAKTRRPLDPRPPRTSVRSPTRPRAREVHLRPAESSCAYRPLTPAYRRAAIACRARSKAAASSGVLIGLLVMLVVHPGRQTHFAITLHGIRRERDDPGSVRRHRIAFRESPRRSDAIHLRHLHIHQDDVIRLPRHRLQRLAPVARQICADSRELRNMCSATRWFTCVVSRRATTAPVI